jgi:hypothetical protein
LAGTSLDHVLVDARLADFKPELEQFAVDTRRTPKRILDAHPPDQGSQIGIDLQSPSPRLRFPTPIAAKAGPMPPNDGLRLDNCDDLQDRRKSSIELDQEPAIGVR